MSGGDGGDAGGPSGEIGASDGEGDRGEKGRQAGRQCGPWGEDIGAAHCGELSVAAQACSLNGASRVVVLLSTVNNPTGGRVGAQIPSRERGARVAHPAGQGWHARRWGRRVTQDGHI